MLPDDNGNSNTDNKKGKEFEDDNENQLKNTIEEQVNGNNLSYYQNDGIGKTVKDATLPL